MLVTVNGFLGNDYVAMLAGQDLPHLEHTVVLRGDAPAGHHVAWADFLAGGDGVDARPTLDASVAALGRGRPSRHPLHVGHHREPEGRASPPTARRCGASPTGPPSSASAQDDRYLVVNPFFHAFGYKAGIVACLTVGATLVPQAVFDIPHGHGATSPSTHHGAPGPAGALPDVPQPPGPRPRGACSRCGWPSPGPPPSRSS